MGNKTFIEDGVIKKIKNGYVFVLCGKKFLQEHRLIVENFIGRNLNVGETIHHIDNNKKNNNINNLMIFPNAKEHIRFHNKVRQFGITNSIAKQIEERWEKFK